MPTDERLPAVASLLGADAARVLAPAVAAAGGRLCDARPTQVRYTPGRRLVARYAARVAWPDGGERVETLGAVAAARLPAGVAVVEAGAGARVGVWRYPHDPFLPGLRHVASPAGAASVLERLGVRARPVEVLPLVYRPGSRAVLRLRVGAATVYAKVLEPRTVAALRRTHRALAGAVRVPRCLGWSEPLGIVVLEALPGRTLARPLVDGGAAPPPPHTVLDLLARLRDVPVDGTPPTPATLTGGAARLLRAVVPGLTPDVAAVVAAADRLPVTAEQTIHGDFYEAQVLVDGASVVGVLDVDGARRGGPHEDPATFVAHLVALAHVHPDAATRIHAYRRELEALLARRIHRETLAAGVAAVLLGLATTPFRRQLPDWPAATADWLRLTAPWLAQTGVGGSLPSWGSAPARLSA